MKLADLRRFSIRKQHQIRFRLRNGMECVVTDRGLAEVPALKGPPDFNLEEELAAAGEFSLESASLPERKNPVPARRVSRDELANMLAPSPSSAAPREHEEE